MFRRQIYTHKCSIKVTNLYRMVLCLLCLLFCVTQFVQIKASTIAKVEDVHRNGDKSYILIISSYNPEAWRMSHTIADFEKTYSRNGGKASCVVRTMDCKSYSESPLWPSRLRQLLDNQYEVAAPNLIVFLGQEAWASYLSLPEKERISEVPVICGLVGSQYTLLPHSNLDTSSYSPVLKDLQVDGYPSALRGGIFYDYSGTENITMLKECFPYTEKVAFISDNTYGGVTMKAIFREGLKAFPELDVEYIDGRKLTLEKALDCIYELEDHTSIMVGTWRIGLGGEYFMHNATYMMQEVSSNTPCMSMASVGLGYWALGGCIPDYFDQGASLARIALSVEKGIQNQIRIVSSSKKVDYNALIKYDIAESELPQGAKIVNMPKGIMEKYFWEVTTGFVVVAALSISLLICLIFYLRSRRLGKHLKIAKEKAEESDRLKTAFLANISHEIRTPLNSIVGFSSVLQEGDVHEEEQTHYLDLIQLNSDLLLRLINDVLDLSRLESGRVQLKFAPVDVISIANQTFVSVQQAMNNGNEFIMKVHQDTCVVMADKQRLQQVLMNILNNANKFTSDGKITLSVYLWEEEQEIVFSVSDTGTGIPFEKQTLVFERFEKLNELSSGTGLGLSICQMLVNMWDGRIWIASDYTEGAKFCFTLPYKEVKN